MISFLSVGALQVQSSSQEKNLIPIDFKDKANLQKKINFCENRIETLEMLKKQIFPETKKYLKPKKKRKKHSKRLFGIIKNP